MSQAPFSRTFHVRWGDMDFNAHMRNTAYLDTAADVRMMYFAANGFAMPDFEELHFGPVILRDDIEYFRELRLLESIEVTLLLAGVSSDDARFRLRNEFFTAKGSLAARLTSTGGWLDLRARKLLTPPAPLASLVRDLPRCSDFAAL